MIRTTKQIKQVDLILCSDIHLREDKPVCRTDDFVNVTQWKKLDFIAELQKKYNCPVLHGGDLFHHWKPSPWLISKTIEHLPKQFYSVAGNHDLPQHNLDLIDKCGVFTLWRSDTLMLINYDESLKGLFPLVGIVCIEGCHWNEIPTGKKNKYDRISNTDRKMLIWHKFTYQGKEPWPDCVEPKASKLLKQYPEYQLIVTGDNHQPFVQEYEGRILVNPGSLSRQKASETHLPRVYLYNAESNTVEPVFIPIEENVITREHLEKEEQRNERIDIFVSQLSENWKVSMSFEDNLQRLEKKNQVRQSVMQIVYKATGV
jgi:DNA repair exonuclease SbcCD nuclease subunit